MATRTYTIELQVEAEVTITSYGSPATGPTYSSGGEPAEGPEFEVESYTIGKVTYRSKRLGDKWVTEVETEGRGKYTSDQSLDSFLAAAIDEALTDKAAEDDWEQDGGDYVD